MNSAIFIMFACSFFQPATARDWRTFSAFSAFIVALFVELYGFPLTIYLQSGWLQTRYPGLDLPSHDAGHLWRTLLGEKGNPYFGTPHTASYVLLASTGCPVHGTCSVTLGPSMNALHRKPRALCPGFRSRMRFRRTESITDAKGIFS